MIEASTSSSRKKRSDSSGGRFDSPFGFHTTHILPQMACQCGNGEKSGAQLAHVRGLYESQHNMPEGQLPNAVS